MAMTHVPLVSRSTTVSRRTALHALSVVAGAATVWPYLSDSAAEAFAAIDKGEAVPAPVFLNAADYATVDALAETIIPTDEHSPGAHAARVVDYIDLLLAESDLRTQQAWSAGLAALDDVSRRRFAVPYVQLAPEQAAELLADIARHELTPHTPLDEFFVAAKSATIRGYYTSEIGIQRELEYKGNRILREFVGCTHPEHGYKATT